MSNRDEIDELKRLVEEERRQKQDKAEHKRCYDALRNNDPEVKKQRKAKAASYFAENRDARYTYSALYKLRKQEERAGRPRPDMCEVCNARGRVEFDHCHDSDKFRGWLCTNCNIILGHAHDDPTVLEKLAVYIRTHKEG